MINFVELSQRLGDAVVKGVGVTFYADALLKGRSEHLSYQDMQEFHDFTTTYLVHELGGSLALVRKDNQEILRKEPGEKYLFSPDGTHLQDYLDELSPEEAE